MTGRHDPRVVTPRSAVAQTLPTAEGSITHAAQPAAKQPPATLSVRGMCERLEISESTFHRIRDEAWMPVLAYCSLS